jgi:hypothetical protein
MIMRWNSAEKRWKKAADAAIAPDRFCEERDRLAGEVAKRIWVANGGRDWADTRNEGSLLALEALVLRHLNDEVVRSALALRHVSVLEDNLHTCDYEDARSLAAEGRWAGDYLSGAMHCALLATPTETTVSPLREPSEDRLDRLRGSLATLVSAELKAASIAAA